VIESTRIEYKADWNPEPIVHSITAFANDFDNLGGGSKNEILNSTINTRGRR
jgi:hypothetical protein